MSGDLRRALEARRGEVERDRGMSGGIYIVEGIVDLLGTGEVIVDVLFPVTYVEKPLVFGGGGVADNQRVIPGEFPRWDVGVHRWNRGAQPDTPDSPTYYGCSLLIIVEGAIDDEDTFQSEAYWTARGRALTNPIVPGL